jgi:hypothetical protein
MSSRRQHGAVRDPDPTMLDAFCPTDIEERRAMAGSQEALDWFERHTAWPMMILALAIIPRNSVMLVGISWKARHQSATSRSSALFLSWLSRADPAVARPIPGSQGPVRR